MTDLVVMTNLMLSAIQPLSLVERRIIYLAISGGRDKGLGDNEDNPLTINAGDYAQMFNIEKNNAYGVILRAERTLFERRFSYLENGEIVKCRWIQRAKYKKKRGEIEIVFTKDVIRNIFRIDGKEQNYTKILLSETIDLKSKYSIHLYQLMSQWKNSDPKKAKLYSVVDLREKLGIEPNEYSRMYDFKKRVLDYAVSQINESKESDFTVSYEQVKSGRDIVAFKFKINKKIKKARIIDVVENRDPNTKDMFTGATDDEMKPLSTSQASYFGSLLANDSGFGSTYANIGESSTEFEKRIKKELTNKEFVKKYWEYLIKQGYKTKN